MSTQDRGGAGHEPGPGGPAADAHLEMLLRLVEAQPGAAVAVTLTTVGGIVSGDLVASRAWAERWEGVVARAVGDQDHAEQVVLLPRALQNALDPTGPDGLHDFAHLIDVTFLSAPGTPTAPLWRGRVSDVSGWSLGAPA
ncbi:hypothetical protein SUDANB58_02553 [Streptomyces sp. enrichment culture]|uniref:hypothetical protein n=1 Tax=Streptomyces sp. enrichment culture TaxID=1795815 RepID=UPI003F57DE04